MLEDGIGVTVMILRYKLRDILFKRKRSYPPVTQGLLQKSSSGYSHSAILPGCYLSISTRTNFISIIFILLLLLVSYHGYLHWFTVFFYVYLFHPSLCYWILITGFLQMYYQFLYLRIMTVTPIPSSSNRVYLWILPAWHYTFLCF